MSGNTKRVMAAILLITLIVVPFINWRLGAVLWMCAWLVFIFQNLYSGRGWKLTEDNDRMDEEE